MIAIARCLEKLRPGEQWKLDGDDYAGLTWLDSTPKPTLAEIESIWIEVQAEAEKPYAANRRAEYPPMADYMDGLVKGDLAQMQTYIDACLAVKAKYPK